MTMKVVAIAVITTSTLLSSCFSVVEGFSYSNLLSRHPALAAKKEAIKRNTRLYYEPSDDNKNKDQPQFNAWSVLSTTEEWISKTLDTANKKSEGNPYSRKEVSYVCETHSDSPMIVAGIFRRLRETREQGERHGNMEEDRKVEQGKNYHPSTLRQTQVVVIPSNQAMTESFHTFDNLVNNINAARRNARDYVTDVSFERLDEKMYGDEEQRDWSVSVNCAHLHPEFGKQTPEQKLQEMKEEEEEGEVDLNLKAYKEQRIKARQSPYPSVVIEVRATPPPDFGAGAMAAPPPPQAKQDDDDDEDDDEVANLPSGVSLSDIQKLEALFGKSAATTKEEKSRKEKENDFYDSIGNSIEEISTVTPLSMAQHWISENDPMFPANAAFTTSNAKHVDEGYEFVFTNLAMQVAADTTSRQYLVMPTFLSSSATSLEKFSVEASKIINVLTDLHGKVQLSTFHPEHIDESRRSPVPIVVLEYTK